MLNRTRLMRGRVWRACQCAALLLLLGGTVASGADRSGGKSVFLVGEELVYNVRYSFFNLGQIRIQTLHKVQGSDYLAYRGKASIASYSSVPFVNVRAIFESTIDSSIYSRAFLSRNKDGERVDIARYTFDYPRGKLFVELAHNDSNVAKRDTIDVPMPYQDGLSLFFFARDRLFANRSFRIPTIIKEEKVFTTINFLDERTEVSVDAVGYPIDVVRFDGIADFVGFFGLTGDFEGWFSNDEARVPIMAKMKVILGSVTIELMEWNRHGWSPPRAGEG